MTEATSLANRAIAERRKFEADAVQYHSEVLDVRQELKIVEERVSSIDRKRKINQNLARYFSHEKLQRT